MLFQPNTAWGSFTFSAVIKRNVWFDRQRKCIWGRRWSGASRARDDLTRRAQQGSRYIYTLKIRNNKRTDSWMAATSSFTIRGESEADDPPAEDGGLKSENRHFPLSFLQASKSCCLKMTSLIGRKPIPNTNIDNLWGIFLSVWSSVPTSAWDLFPDGTDHLNDGWCHFSLDRYTFRSSAVSSLSFYFNMFWRWHDNLGRIV